MTDSAASQRTNHDDTNHAQDKVATTRTMSTSTSPASLRDSSQTAARLNPKEHGAYAILSVPIATAFLIAESTIPGLCITIAAFAGFFANEPLLVVWGHRGSRAQRTTPAAMSRLAILIAITVVCGSLAWWLSTTNVRIALLACLLFAVSSFAIGVIGQHRALGAQIWGIVGLSAPCIPILLAGSQPPSQAIAIWSMWLIGFASTTLAVRGVIATQKRHSRLVHWTGITALSAATGLLIAVDNTFVYAVLPMVFMSWYLMIQPPPAKQLRRVGWSLVAGTIATAVGMVGLALS